MGGLEFQTVGTGDSFAISSGVYTVGSGVELGFVPAPGSRSCLWPSSPATLRSTRIPSRSPARGLQARIVGGQSIPLLTAGLTSTSIPNLISQGLSDLSGSSLTVAGTTFTLDSIQFNSNGPEILLQGSVALPIGVTVAVNGDNDVVISPSGVSLTGALGLAEWLVHLRRRDLQGVGAGSRLYSGERDVRDHREDFDHRGRAGERRARHGRRSTGVGHRRRRRDRLERDRLDRRHPGRWDVDRERGERRLPGKLRVRDLRLGRLELRQRLRPVAGPGDGRCSGLVIQSGGLASLGHGQRERCDPGRLVTLGHRPGPDLPVQFRFVHRVRAWSHAN